MRRLKKTAKLLRASLDECGPLRSFFCLFFRLELEILGYSRLFAEEEEKKRPFRGKERAEKRTTDGALFFRSLPPPLDARRSRLPRSLSFSLSPSRRRAFLSLLADLLTASSDESSPRARQESENEGGRQEKESNSLFLLFSQGRREAESSIRARTGRPSESAKKLDDGDNAALSFSLSLYSFSLTHFPLSPSLPPINSLPLSPLFQPWSRPSWASSSTTSAAAPRPGAPSPCT